MYLPDLSFLLRGAGVISTLGSVVEGVGISKELAVSVVEDGDTVVGVGVGMIHSGLETLTVGITRIKKLKICSDFNYIYIYIYYVYIALILIGKTYYCNYRDS